MKIYSPNREERAFLYQEAQELAPLMKELGSLSVMVEEMRRRGKPLDTRYRVTFVVAPESVGMKVQATDYNLFDATIAARNEAQRQLNELVNALPRERAPGAEAEGKSPAEFLH
jgi:hypothetical protein